MGTDDAQRRGDGGTRHDCEQTDGENGIQQSLFHNKRFKINGDCSSTKLRKEPFRGAKVAIFLQKIHPGNPQQDCRGEFISINKEFNQTVPVLSTIAILALKGQSCRPDVDGQAEAVIWGHG